MEYNHKDIEKRWQNYWKENNVYTTEIDQARPKYYVLDMFPYSSGVDLPPSSMPYRPASTPR